MISIINFREMALQKNIDIINGYFMKNASLSIHDFIVSCFS